MCKFSASGRSRSPLNEVSSFKVCVPTPPSSSHQLFRQPNFYISSPSTYITDSLPSSSSPEISSSSLPSPTSASRIRYAANRGIRNDELKFVKGKDNADLELSQSSSPKLSSSLPFPTPSTSRQLQRHSRLNSRNSNNILQFVEQKHNNDLELQTHKLQVEEKKLQFEKEKFELEKRERENRLVESIASTRQQKHFMEVLLHLLSKK